MHMNSRKSLLPSKHEHVEVLQQNTTEFRWGTIIEDIEVLVHELVFTQQLLFLEKINQWLHVLGTHMEWRQPTYQTIEHFARA